MSCIRASLVLVKTFILKGIMKMKFRYSSFLLAAMLLLNSVGFAASDTPRAAAAKKRAAANRLVSLLPASDGIAVFDANRFLGEGLPKVLASNQPMLAEITGKIDAMSAKTGIDLKKFDQVAVGVALKQVSPTETDYDTVAIASGAVNTGGLIEAAKASAKGKFREESRGSRTVYIFNMKDVAFQNTSAPAGSKVGSFFDKMLNSITNKEVAVVVYDPSTIIMGSPARVMQALETRSNGDADVRALLPARDTAVVSFAARTNGMLSKLIPLDTDLLGENIDSIQYMAGSLDLAAPDTNLNVLARTKKPEQAKSLKETLDGLKLVGKAFLGSSKRTDQQVYGRMLENARITATGSDVALSLKVPQADLDILLAEK